MSDSIVKIALDSSSSFEALVPIQDQFAALPDGTAADLSMELEDPPSASVLFALGQMLFAAKKQGCVESKAIAALVQDHASLGAILAKTGLQAELIPTS